MNKMTNPFQSNANFDVGCTLPSKLPVDCRSLFASYLGEIANKLVALPTTESDVSDRTYIRLDDDSCSILKYLKGNQC